MYVENMLGFKTSNFLNLRAAFKDEMPNKDIKLADIIIQWDSNGKKNMMHMMGSLIDFYSGTRLRHWRAPKVKATIIGFEIRAEIMDFTAAKLSINANDSVLHKY